MFAGLQRALFEPLLKNKEDRGAGEVAHIREHIPGRLRLAFRKAQRDFHIAEEARSAGMQNPALNILLLLAVTLEEAVDELADFGANHFWDVLSEQDVKSGVPQVEAHGADGI